MKVFVVLATVLAAASANPQILLQNGLYGGAITYSAAPIATQYISSPAVIAPAVTKTQYHAQDELGQASYGYAHPGQAHAAIRDAAGNVRGSYAYVNPEGKEVRVEYVADGNGFRVASNALPLGPVAQPVAKLIAPAPVVDTPEVAQAKIAHAAAHADALARSGRKKRGVVNSLVVPSTLGYSNVIAQPALGYSHVVAQPSVAALGYSNVIAQPSVAALGYSNVISHPTVALGHVAASPVAYSAVASPVAYSAVAAPAVVATQAVREATLTKVHNNPGHAVSYRVD